MAKRRSRHFPYDATAPGATTSHHSEMQRRGHQDGAHLLKFSSCTGSTGMASSRRGPARQLFMPYHNPKSTVTYQQPSWKEKSLSPPSGIIQQPHYRGPTDNHVFERSQAPASEAAYLARSLAMTPSMEERSTKQGEAERQSSIDKQLQELSISSATVGQLPGTAAAAA
eukprot:scpid108384/ scgid21060/ 